MSCASVKANPSIPASGLETDLKDEDGVAFTMNKNFEDMLIDGARIGKTAGYCYLAVFKSEEVDTWYFGNMMMEDYYVVFDATSADENNQDYIMFGIAEIVSSGTLSYQSGSLQNVFYYANGTEIDNTKVQNTELTDDQRDDLKTVLAIALYVLFNAGAVAIAAFFIWEFVEIYNDLYQETDQYFSAADFGYPASKLLNPIEITYVLAIPYIWEQIKWKLIISSSITSVCMFLGFLVFMPSDIVILTIYLQYLVYIFKEIDLEPEMNLLEVVQLEQTFEMLFSYLLLADVSLAGSAMSIAFIVGTVWFI